MKTRITFLALFAGFVLLILYFLNCNTCVGCHGIINGHFIPCSRSPNCVSSQMDDDTHYIAPMHYAEKDTPIPRLAQIVKTIPKTRILKQDSDYLHVEFRSPKFNFVDDAEFLWNRQQDVIEMRSAARCGYGDGGVNRKRLEAIRRQFEN